MAVAQSMIVRASRVIVLLSLLSVSCIAPAAVVVIANRALPVDTLTAEQVRDLFLGKSNRLPDGTPCKVIDQVEGRPVRNEFYEKVLLKTPEQAKAYWAKMVFTGHGIPPQVLVDDAAVRTWVSRHAGGIGYVDESAVDGSVKVVLRP